MAARLCPHCGALSNFTQRTSLGGRWGPREGGVTVDMRIEQCQNCGGLLILLDGTGSAGRAEFLVYPTSVPAVDEAVPQRIRDDYVEGVRCLDIRATKAAATLFRRALQQVMIDQGAEGRTLNLQVQDLAQKGQLPPSLVEMADEIRLWGNLGAHPDSDGLDEIDRGGVQAGREFLDRVFEWLYIFPARVAATRAARLGPASSTPEETT